MTSDIIQSQFVAEQQNRGFFGFLQQKSPAPLTSDPHISALLKSAYDKLKQAETDLAIKDQRIQSLERHLTVDELTGLVNRRGFYRRFESELDRTNRGENKGGLLVMIDLDGFKAINDTYGHNAGDEALRCVGAFLTQTTRPMDCVVRLGGDEFIVLMPNTCIHKAMKRAKKIGDDLNALSFDWKGKRIKINGSLGLQEFKSGDTIETIIDHADEGMYAQKEERKLCAVR